MNFFEVEKVNKHITRIKMPYVCSYIIHGSDRAALIDTGFGYGDLRSVVEPLIDTPYDVINTHGHPDHVGGNMQWDAAYLPEGEVELEAYGGKVSTRHMIMNRVLRKENKSFDIEGFLPYKELDYTYYNESDTFDLGGITLVPIHMPGHTKGIMSFFIPELRILMAGDACSNPTILVVESSASVEEFREGLLKLTKIEDQFDTVLIQHEGYTKPKAVIRDNLYWSEQILEGKDDHYKVHLGGVDCYVARNKFKSHDKGLLGNVVYTNENIWKNQSLKG